MVVVGSVAALVACVTVVAQAGAAQSPSRPAVTRSMPLPGTPTVWPVPSRFSRIQLVQLSGTHSIAIGGQLLVGVGLPGGVAPRQVTVSLDGRDVTAAFDGRYARLDPSFHGLVGLVTGLKEGANELRAEVGASGQRDRTVVYDYPPTGPIFSGAQLQPWFCTTQTFGLGTATDAACDAPTVIQYWYMSASGSFKQLTDLTSMPTERHPAAWLWSRLDPFSTTLGCFQS